MSDRSADNFSRINIDDGDRVVPSSRTARPSPPPTDSAPRGGQWLSLILCIMLGLAAGYLFYLHTQAQVALNDAQQRISKLEQRLSATGEEMDSSTLVLQAKLTELTAKSEELWAQMDKLWASAWRRNQKELRDLETVVEDQRTQLQKGQNVITANVAAATKANDALNLDINNVRNELLAVNLEIESVKQSLLSGQNSVGLVNDKIAILEQRNTALREKVTQLERSMATLRLSPTS